MLHFKKIAEDIWRFEKMLNKDLPLAMNTDRERIFNIEVSESELTIELLNSFTAEPISITYTEEADFSAKFPIRSSDDIYFEKITNIIKNYKDSIEENFNAKLEQIKNILDKEVYIYKTENQSYIYAFHPLIAIVDEDGLQKIYEFGTETSIQNITAIENAVLKEILKSNKQMLSDKEHTIKINIYGEEYINIRSIENLIENSEEYIKNKNNKKKLVSLDKTLNKVFLFSVLFDLIFAITQLKICLYISMPLMIILGAISLRINDQKKEINNKEDNYNDFLKENKNKLYIEINKIKDILKEYNLEEVFERKFMEEKNNQNDISDKVISSKVPNIDYNIRSEHLKEINILLDEIEKKGLDKENPIIYSYYIPELKNFEENIDNIPEEYKKEVNQSIDLLKKKLQSILDEDKKEEDISLIAQVRAFNDSLK